MGLPLSAKNAKIRLNDFVFYGAEWNVDPQSDWPDTSNFESGGFEEQVACFRKCSVSFKGFWDGDDNPHGDVPNLNDGQNITNVNLYISGTDGPFWSFPVLSIMGTPTSASCKGIVEISVSGKGNGAFVAPSGNIS